MEDKQNLIEIVSFRIEQGQDFWIYFVWDPSFPTLACASDRSSHVISLKCICFLVT